ncbi:MAG TPA: SusD/RagB family nutrient-binding outer membrane lipoprotein, partial [Dinghuibacter sp.]|uniref:SusD/RagB family nutrient-binding outer membrane lipoprotein n=1 Tax=Dinghuibacter sp. TaxID=2024697 RepID=UPI002C16D111
MKQKLLILSAALIFSAGCKKNFESINTDPEHVTSAVMNYNYLFTAAELITSGNSDGNCYEDWRNNLIYAGCMIQHFSSTTGYWDGDKYFYNPSYNSAYWDNNYPNTITNIVETVYHTKGDATQTNLYNIARIFKAFMFQRMTDMYGDCPYSQAGMGYIANITSPVYDKQQAIYDSLYSELSDAAANLSATATNTVGSADLVYGGNVAEWKKFAYSEMLRIGMRLSKVDPTTAQKWVQAAVAGGVMTSNADDAMVQHQNQHDQTANGSGSVLVYQDPNASRLSATFVNYLKSTGDPRLTYIGTVCTSPGTAWGAAGFDYGDTSWFKQLGQPNGYDLNGSTLDLSTAPGYPGNQNDYSVANRYTFARLNAPTFFLTNAETQFLLAEAAERGWITGDPATYYAAGVTAGMNQMAETGATPGITQAQITTYLAANPYNAGNALQQINTQYWVATFMDEYEAWANWRRSGYPVLTAVNYPGNATNGT